jgi:phage-related minor tail protein
LGQAVEETKNKLETLKTAQQQADEALKNGTITADQYDALQREIIETGTIMTIG